MSERLMEKKNFAIRGMSCAACAAKIERNVKKVQGVSEVNVMLLKNSMTVVCDDEKVTDECIEKAVSDAGYEAFATDGSVKLEQADDSEAKHQKNRLIASFLLLAVLVLLAMGAVIKSMKADSPVNECMRTITKAAMVPMITEVAAAITAMVREVTKALMIALSSISTPYHLNENEVQMVTIFESLKEYTTKVMMGRYKKINAKVRIMLLVAVLFLIFIILSPCLRVVI